ncbi:MAG: ACP S-malonyltransferase [Burkholderiales bacterium]
MKYAFVFPGQGSQSIGMMGGFDDFPIVRETFGQASDILHQDLWKLAAEGPADALNQTVNTQPLMLAAGVAIYRAWTQLSASRPAILAGHSLGEYSALVASNAIAFEDALPLVRFRALAMQEAVPEGTGGIAAVLGLEDEAVKEVCLAAAQGEVLEAVNFNSPGQVVIAGHRDAVLRGMEAAKEKGAKRAIMLPMSVPSHCSLMKPAAQALDDYLKNVHIGKPEIPVLHNVDVKPHVEPEAIRSALVNQLDHPVRWVETIRAIFREGIGQAAECGPGKVLAGLNKRIEPAQIVLALTDSAALRAAADTLNKEGAC